MTEGKRRIEVNWVQSMAGALAAVTSAVLLSTVGVVGTVVGAALGSIVVTVGSAVYSYYIGATKDRVSTVSAVAASRIGRAQKRVESASQGVAEGEPGAEHDLAEAEAHLHRARSVLTDVKQDPVPVGWRTVLAGLPWKRVALAAAGIFVAAMLVILAFELVSGRSVSSYTGGSDTHQRSSIPGLGGGGEGEEDPQPVPEDAPSAVPSDDTGTTVEPIPTPTPTTDGTTEPTPTRAPRPSSTASNDPSPTDAPSPTEPAPTEAP